MDIKPLPIHLTTSPRSWLDRLFHSITTTSKPCWSGTLVEFGSCVWLQHTHDIDPFESGLFGKGSLSRAQPTWKSRTIDKVDKNAVFLEHITVERRKLKRNQENNNPSSPSPSSSPSSSSTSLPETRVWNAKEIKEMTHGQDYEQVLLDFYEAFFLVFALDALIIYDPFQKPLSIDTCWSIFSNHTPHFATRYTVYHYYRSLGWAPKQGTKFGVDFVLYRPGRKHHHGDFAVVVMTEDIDATMDWKELHRLNRVCTQVKKTLVLCYVIKPSPQNEQRPQCLSSYQVQEVIWKRWSPERNREK
ncbi:hypothetical protein BDA99DRAFT_125799 [Phascolomyces articulosus]|uniref:tRNA-splicing endonuclease subunit Sen2 n=1 Tax=Phascolomyces articulosus TaxID=60185 RepID=A0AAD5KPW1_9FUNG|nr:hypothetical protein BDA99DRAFT_125799 [Phascolomyces articulosus]